MTLLKATLGVGLRHDELARREPSSRCRPLPPATSLDIGFDCKRANARMKTRTLMYDSVLAYGLSMYVLVLGWTKV